jgi:OOP family OmpA-OmpF porin
MLAVVLASGAAFADPQDVVTGPGKQPVRSTKFGNCVVTKWAAQSDVCATAPEPVKQVEAPPPAPAPEPVAKLQREDLTIYFNFNKDILTEGGKAKLDNISDAVNHSPKVTKVNIVGYTDEIGSNSYNNALSIRRAKAVKAYIDSKMRIPSNVASLRGKGKEDPVVDCKKVKKRKEKIDCMAKDRRVEIEFEFVQ